MTRVEAAEQIMSYLDNVALISPNADLHPIQVERNGKKFVIVVVQEQVWDEFEDALQIAGCSRIPRRFQ